MEPISMIAALLQGGLSIAGSLQQMQGQKNAVVAMRRQALLRTTQLETNAEIATMRTGFEQARAQGQVDATISRQNNHYASGNIDPNSGSPAILAAQTEALGMQDQMLLAARGVQERADSYGQIADAWGRVADGAQAGTINSASSALSSVGKLAGIAAGMYAATGGRTPAAAAAPVYRPLSWELY